MPSELSALTSLDLEESLLKTVVIFPELLNQAKDLIPDAAVFYSTPYRVIWMELCNLSNTEKAEQYGSLELEQLLLHQIRGHATSETFEYRDILTALIDRSSAAPMSLEQVCLGLVDVFHRRQVAGVLSAALAGVTEMQDLGIVLSELEGELYRLQQQRSGIERDWHVRSGETAQEEYGGDLDAYLDAPDISIKTGLVDLDGVTMGLRPGELSIIAGRPSMGKSALAGYIANAIAQQSRPVIFFSMEMNPLDLDLRRVSLLCKIDGKKFLQKTLNGFERQAAREVWHAMKKTPLFYFGNPRTTVSNIRTELRRHTALHGRIGAFVVDYLQLMGNGEANRNNEIELITKELKALAIEFQTHCICLSQLSRSVESRSNKRPILSDLRDSGGIEQNADLVVLLYRDEYYNSDTCNRGITELNVIKNRKATVGTVKVLTQLEYSNYENLARMAY